MAPAAIMVAGVVIAVFGFYTPAFAANNNLNNSNNLNNNLNNKNILSFENAWIRQTINQGQPAAMYGVLKSKIDCQEIHLKSPIDAAELEIHQMKMANQQMQMLHLEKVSLKANQAFEMSGEYHVMLMNPKKILQVGDVIPVTLICKNLKSNLKSNSNSNSNSKIDAKNIEKNTEKNIEKFNIKKQNFNVIVKPITTQY